MYNSCFSTAGNNTESSTRTMVKASLTSSSTSSRDTWVLTRGPSTTTRVPWWATTDTVRASGGGVEESPRRGCGGSSASDQVVPHFVECLCCTWSGEGLQRRQVVGDPLVAVCASAVLEQSKIVASHPSGEPPPSSLSILVHVEQYPTRPPGCFPFTACTLLVPASVDRGRSVGVARVGAGLGVVLLL